MGLGPRLWCCYGLYSGFRVWGFACVRFVVFSLGYSQAPTPDAINFGCCIGIYTRRIGTQVRKGSNNFKKTCGHVVLQVRQDYNTRKLQVASLGHIGLL